MRQKIYWVTVGAVSALALFWGTAQAEYGSAKKSNAAKPGESSFQRVVDPDRFRKGNPDWDTQEMIAAGFNALHEEHVKILKEIEELKTAVSRLEKTQ